jgi:hypothetical protein
VGIRSVVSPATPNGAQLTADGLVGFHISTGGQSIRGLSFGLSLQNKPIGSAAPGVDSNGDYTAGVDALFGSGGA